jgi:hypothetical protein
MRTCRNFFILMILIFSASCGFAQSFAPPSAVGCASPALAPLPNVNQLALLRWYGANTVNTFPTSGAPNGIAFDGANLWVVGGPPNSVSKFRANDEWFKNFQPLITTIRAPK